MDMHQRHGDLRVLGIDKVIVYLPARRSYAGVGI